jgi:hypothetical protein
MHTVLYRTPLLASEVGASIPYIELKRLLQLPRIGQPPLPVDVTLLCIKVALDELVSNYEQ